MPIGAFVYNVEVKPGNGGKLGRAAGTHIEVVARDQGYVDLKMPSSEVRKVLENCWATLGEVSNPENKLVNLARQAAPAGLASAQRCAYVDEKLLKKIEGKKASDC
jgi:ribosomal protein L2